MSNSSQLNTDTYIVFQSNINSTSTNMQQTANAYVTQSTDMSDQGQRTNGSVIQMSQNEVQSAAVTNQCFICSSDIAREVEVPVKFLTTRSHAPLIVLLTDVLGYRFEDVELHSDYVCKTCYRLVNLIDELQQTLTESKTEVRAKFLDTLQKLKLKYPRTEKILKQRCVHSSSNCIAKKKEPTAVVENHIDTSDISSILDTPCCSNEGTMKNTNDPIAEKIASEPENTELERSDTPVYDNDPAFYFSEERLKVGVHRSSDDTYACLYCRESFDGHLALRLHTRAFHLPSFVYEKTDGAPNLSNKKPRIGMHLQDVTMRPNGKCEQPYSCLYCHCTYKLLSTLLLHYKENHSEVKPFRCQYCGQSFRRAIQRTRHQVYHCQKCAKT